MRYALALALLALVLLSAADSAQSSQPFFAPCASTAPQSTTPEQPSRIDSRLGVGIGPDCTMDTADDHRDEYQFGGIIDFTPPEWGVAEDDDIPDGAAVGTLNMKAIFGLLNNPCTVRLPVNFTLLDGTTNVDDTISPLPPGTPNRMLSLTQDGDFNGVPDGADHWPDFLTTVMLRSGLDENDLRARIFGANVTSVPGTAVVINLLVFEPGVFLGGFGPLDPRLGYPTISILQDPTAPVSPTDPVNDFCASIEMRQTLFDELGGVTYRGNPGDGTYFFTTLAIAQPDADADGIENGLDSCPLSADPLWNPRNPPDLGGTQTTGDPDGDGIPDSCDPDPSTPSICASQMGVSQSDEDCDGWANRSDNCALTANGNQSDLDGDQIGDACDPTPHERSSAVGFVYECLVTAVAVGSGTGHQGPHPNVLMPCCPLDHCSSLLGDVDCNGVVDPRDALTVLRHDAGTASMPCPQNSITCLPFIASDALTILRYDARLIPFIEPAPCP